MKDYRENRNLDIELSFEIEINDHESPLDFQPKSICHENFINQKITFNIDAPVEKIKIFSLKNFIPGKMQSVHIISMKVNNENYTDFHKFCGFEMIGNQYVENVYLKKQNVLCFNGDFYFDIQDNLEQFLWFPFYHSDVQDDFINNNLLVECQNILGCLHGNGGGTSEQLQLKFEREATHLHQWQNYPYDPHFLTKGKQVDVACFGCSVTYGKSIGRKFAWPALMEEKKQKNHINLGQPAMGADSIYQNLKHSLNEFEIKKVIVLFPDLYRMCSIIEKANRFFRIPQTLKVSNDHTGTFHTQNFWFNRSEIGRSTGDSRKKILNGKDLKDYNKEFILLIKNLLLSKKIPFLFSSWNEETYTFLKSQIGETNMLPFFEIIDHGEDIGPYERYPGKLSHKNWVEKTACNI